MCTVGKKIENFSDFSLGDWVIGAGLIGSVTAGIAVVPAISVILVSTFIGHGVNVVTKIKEEGGREPAVIAIAIFKFMVF